MSDVDLRGMRVLIVGGVGFVGSNLVRRVATSAERVLVVDNLLSADIENLPRLPNVAFTRGSIADDDILTALDDEFDYIFHLATYHGNQSSIADPIADHDNNLITTLKLLDRVKGNRRLKRFVYAASGCTLAPHTDDSPEPVEEDGFVPIDLDSPYQISKVVGEFYCVYYGRQHGVPTVRARFQNVYGPGEILGAGQWRGTPATVWRNVVPTFVYRAVNGMPLNLDNEGQATRDFIYVDDVIEGLIQCAGRGTAGDVYNLASGVETSIRQLADLINRLTNNGSGIVLRSRRSWDRSGRRVGSTKKAQYQLGFVARTSLVDGLKRTIEWTRAHQDLIADCIHSHDDEMLRHRMSLV